MTPPARDSTAVLRDLGAALRAAAPAGAARLRYRAVVVGDVRRDQLTAEPGTGEELPVPAAVRRAAEELKRAMWTPERGTWLQTEMVLDLASGRLVPIFNAEAAPPGPPLPPGAVAAELRAYPRPPGAVPGWMGEPTG
ncbi:MULTISPECIES: hypothetical protein [Geodermatophilus]|uniref:Uncharacterized protein n=1 Tax=Geodermatophilus nigrescens TaxID=1070870 RepID=A0A1M5EUQ0_9ACTN|nr:hypothetical protein [Geodermatophilus nigrescens]SHF82742.1 hypothetical protein SAMN05444351_0937 [Geodermatophilus nigrescens]